MGVPGSQESLGDLEYFPRVVIQSASEVVSRTNTCWGGGGGGRNRPPLPLSTHREVLVVMSDG